MAAQNGHVRVIALEILIAVSIDDGKVVVVVLLADESAGVLAERAHLILERARIANQLALVQHAVDLFHDLVAAFDAHADIDRAGLMGDAMLSADFFQPIRAAATRCHDGMLGANLLRLLALAQGHAHAGFAVHNQLFAFPSENQLHAVFTQVIFQREIERLCLFRAEMANRAIDQLQACANGAAANLAHLFRITDALDMAIRAELKVDTVGIVDEILRVLLTDERREIAADLMGERELTIRKRARAGKAGRDMTIRAAVDAVIGDRLRAAAFFDGLTLFDDDDMLMAALTEHFNCGKDACRARADDDDIRIHIFSSCHAPQGVFLMSLILVLRGGRGNDRAADLRPA